MKNLTYTIEVTFGSKTCRRSGLNKKEAARLIESGWQHDADEIWWGRSDMPNMMFDYYDMPMAW